MIISYVQEKIIPKLAMKNLVQDMIFDSIRE